METTPTNQRFFKIRSTILELYLNGINNLTLIYVYRDVDKSL